MTTSELDKFWREVKNGGHNEDTVLVDADADVGGTVYCDASMADGVVPTGEWLPLGVKAGELSFDVPRLRRKQQPGSSDTRILPEDGTYVPPGTDVPGGRFGPEWREEELTRQKILENDPNYQFLTLVAGASNEPVNRLYEEDSVGEAMRRRLGEQQARLAAQESVVELERLKEALRELEVEDDVDRNVRDAVELRQNSEYLAAASAHARAVSDYVGANMARRETTDLTDFFLRARNPMVVPATLLDAARRIVRAQFSDDEGAGVSTNYVALVSLLVSGPGADAIDISSFDGDAAESVPDLLEGLIELSDPARENGAVRVAPLVLVRALKRLIILKFAPADSVDDVIARAASGDLAGAESDVDAGVVSGAEFEMRNNAWRPWLVEARELSRMLTEAANQITVKSELMTPLVEIPGAQRPSLSAVLNVPTAQEQQFIRDVEAIKSNVESAILLGIDTTVGSPESRTSSVFAAAGLGGDSSDLNSDVLLDSMGVTLGSRERQYVAWERAMAQYESLGGTLFERLGTAFPISPEVRETRRARVPIPRWSLVTGIPPPSYSTRMLQLWNRVVPTMQKAIEKAAIPATRSTMTPTERLAWRTLYRAPPERAGRLTWVERQTAESLLVTAGRLYEFDLAQSLIALEKRREARASLYQSTQDRIEGMLRGDPNSRRAPTVPYEHRRGWVEEPEHSGVVRMLPIVVTSIATAWGFIQRHAPDIARNVDVEFLQHDPQIRADFAQLVAIEMSFIAQRFPKKYLQLGLRRASTMDRINVINHFKHNYNLRRAPGSAPPRRPRLVPARGESYVASMHPVGHDSSNLILF